MSDVLNRIELCKTSDIAPGEISKIETDDLVLAVYNVEGNFFVTDDACTHGPAFLSEGELDGHIIECDFHQGAFDIRTGEVAAPPCLLPIKTYSVIVEGDTVYISV